MANPDHVEILKRGTEAWHQWFGKHTPIKPDLSNADLQNIQLTDAILVGADFSYANLHGAILQRTTLIDCILNSANLDEADLEGAILTGASLRGTNLSQTNLKKAELLLATLFQTNLQGADLQDSRMLHTVIAATDLSAALGLETIRHEGPSIIDINTLYRSHGKISEVFLRGCGVPKDFITYARSLVTNPIEYLLLLHQPFQPR